MKMRDPVDNVGPNAPAASGQTAAETTRGTGGSNYVGGSGAARADGVGWGSTPDRSDLVPDPEGPAAPPPPGGPLVTSPFVQTPVQGNFFNLANRGMGGMGRQQRSPFMPTNNLLRMLEQMRMQKLNDLYYQPYLSAFGRRF